MRSDTQMHIHTPHTSLTQRVMLLLAPMLMHAHMHTQSSLGKQKTARLKLRIVLRLYWQFKWKLINWTEKCGSFCVAKLCFKELIELEGPSIKNDLFLSFIKKILEAWKCGKKLRKHFILFHILCYQFPSL